MLHISVDRGSGLRAAAIALFVIALSACDAPLPAGTGRVIDVADGDTLVVRMAGEDVRVRLFGVDAPESDQAYGAEARRVARDLLLGHDVVVHKRDVDQYDRVVAALTIEGTDVGAELIARGAAWHYREFTDEVLYAESEAAARREGVGLWRAADPTPPWIWRVSARRDRAPRESGPAIVRTSFSGNARSQVFHARGCEDFACSNCTVAFATAADALAAGYRPHSCAREAGR